MDDMSDDPREATAGDGLSAERVAEIRRQLSHAGAGWIDDVKVFPGTSETRFCTVTLGELKQLLDAHDALQAAREQLDEARIAVGNLEFAATDSESVALAATEAMKRAERERDATREELDEVRKMLAEVLGPASAGCDELIDDEHDEAVQAVERADAYLDTRGAGGAQGEE